MKNLTRLMRSTGVLIAATLFAPSFSYSEVKFLYGSKIEDGFYFETSNLVRDTLVSLGINDMMVYATHGMTSWATHIDSLAAIGVSVRGTNTWFFTEGAEEEYGFISEALHYRSPAFAIYNVWQAEDTHITAGSVGVGLQHRIGSATSDGWVVSDAVDEPDTIYTGPRAVLGGGAPVEPIHYRVQYRMRLTGFTGSDSVDICRIHGLHEDPNPPDCELIPNPMYDVLLEAEDFKNSQGQYGSWSVFEADFSYVKESPIPGCSASDTIKINQLADYRVYWFGKGTLEIDWVRCADLENAVPLVYDSSDALRRLNIKRQASYFADDSVASWFGDESGYFNPSHTESYTFVDSIVSTTVHDSSGREVFVFEDVSLHPLACDSADCSEYWDLYMYKMLKYESLKELDVWYIGFDADMEDSGFGADEVNERWYNEITTEMSKHVMPYMDPVEDARVIAEVQAHCKDSNPNADKFPRKTDISCQAFLYLACGAKGLVYNRFDGNLYSNGLPAWGLMYRYPTKSDPLVYSTRYRAARNWVSPLLVDSTGSGEPWGDLLAGLDWRGAGAADTLAEAQAVSFNYITGFVAGAASPWVEAGFFVDAANAADYLMLVNRRTTDDTSQTVVVDLDPTRLQDPSGSHYYVIDMNPQDTLRGEDTLLAGPMGGIIRFSEAIRPGGVKLMRIERAPDRVASSTFPIRWWGVIQANEGLSLSSNRSLHIAPGCEVSIHTECGYSEEYPAKFYVNGSLKAVGTSDSTIVFSQAFDGPPQGIECDTVGDTTRWGGVEFTGSAPCSLSYCEIRNSARPVYSLLQPLALDHVTTTNSVGPACYLLGTGQQYTLTSCTFDGDVQTFGGRVTMDYCRIDGASIGLEARAAGQYSDTVTIKHSVVVNSDSIGIYANGYPVSLRSCTLSVADIGIKARSAPLFIDTVKLLNCGQAVLVDTSATLSGQKLHVVYAGIGINVRKGWGSLGTSTFSVLDTVVYSDPASEQTLRLSHLNALNQCKKGIVTRSGTLQLDTCVVFADSFTAIDAYTGSTVVRMTYSGAQGPSNSAAAVSIGPNSRLVAKGNSDFSNSWIGIELRRNGADTIMNCSFYDNTLYGIWCDSGTTMDLLSGNYMVNDTASAANFGVNVLLQSVRSVNDTIMGGYNWNFNFNSGHRADVINLVARGKAGDDWGLVFNGPLASNDSAFAMGVDVSDRYDGAHLYLKSLYASIKESHFVSTGNPLSASAYGVKDMGSTTGIVRCTEVSKQKTDLVYIASGSSMNWGTAADHGKNNVFGGTSGSTTYVRKLGGTTVLAEYCWWGASPPDAGKFVGPVDYTPYESDSVECFSEPGAKIVANTLIPAVFALDQNYPNPFNPATTIGYSLETERQVTIEIFNLLGQQVRIFALGMRSPGVGEISWNGTDQSGRPVGSGLYLYRITSGDFVETKKMLLLK